MAICIIPARSGSKRIKNKNLRKINNVPLIVTTIKLAIKSKLFKRIIVSTDSPKIAELAKKNGAEVPFLRSKKLSDDYTPTHKVMVDAIKKIKSMKEEFHFCIYPTSILLDQNDLKKALNKIKKTNSNFICPIAKFESNPFRSFYIKGAQIKYNWPIFQMKRSQDLRDLYYDTGSFYIYRTRTLIKIRKKKNLPTKTTFIILKKKLIDINYPEDLNELKFLIKKNN